MKRPFSLAFLPLFLIALFWNIALYAQQRVRVNVRYNLSNSSTEIVGKGLLKVYDDNTVKGYITWQLGNIDEEHADRLNEKRGAQCKEKIAGTYNAEENLINLNGISKEDPDGLGSKLDEYELYLADDNILNGRKKGGENGSWKVKLSGNYRLEDNNESTQRQPTNAYAEERRQPSGNSRMTADDWRKKGDEAKDAENYKDAIKCYSNAVQLAPNCVECYTARGYSYSKLLDKDQAIADYTRAINLEPNSPYTYALRGLSFYLQDKYEEVIADCSQVIKLGSKSKIADALAYCYRGKANFKLKKYSLALADLNTSIKLRNNDEDAYSSRADVYYEMKKYAQAITDYTMAIKLAPNDAGNYHFRGHCYDELKKYDLALKDYTMAVQLDPSDKEAQDHIAEAKLSKQGYNGNYFIVNSNTGYTDIILKKGQKVVIEAKGAIVLGAFSGAAGPDGKSWANLWTIDPNYLYGALLYKIGNEKKWHLAGSNTSFTAQSAGKLMLCINDTDPNDNSGEFNVSVYVKK